MKILAKIKKMLKSKDNHISKLQEEKNGDCVKKPGESTETKSCSEYRSMIH